MPALSPRTLTRSVRRSSTSMLASRAGASASHFEQLEQRRLLAIDLVAGDVTAASQTIEPGENIVADVEFANEGDTAASAFRVQVRLSSDSVFGNADDIVIGRIRRPAGLAAGDFDSQERQFTVPEDTEPGNYFIGFLVDSLNTNNESSESNNAVVSDSALITVAGNGPGEGEIDIRGRNDVAIASGDNTVSFTDGTAFGAIRTDNVARNRTFTIDNLGDGELTIDDIVISGAGAAGFEIVDQPDQPIQPGESATFVVQFDPDTIGVHRAVVTVISDDADEGEYTFAISGRGRGPVGIPDIAVSGFAPIADGDLTASVGDGTNFGVATVGQFIDREFTITNSNTGDLVLTSPFITITGRNPSSFTIIDMPDDTVLGPGESTTFTVRFSTNSPGTRKATIQIRSNDSDEALFDFQVRGRGHPNNGRG